MGVSEKPSATDVASLNYVETLYEAFLQNPDSVAPEWRDYFAAEARAAGVPPHHGLGP